MTRTPLLTALFGLLASAHATGQTYHASPDGLLTNEGMRSSSVFGAFASARFQIIDGELRNKPGVIQNVAMRPDYTAHSISTATGRSWTRVTLDMASSDFANRSTNFSVNARSAPTRVFDGRASWPTITGTPRTQPAAFGGGNGTIQFPLSQGYVVAGTDDLSLDFQFTGGVLANPALTWGNAQFMYNLDSYGPQPDSHFGQENRYGPSLQSGGCSGPGSNQGWGGHAQVSTTTYSKSSPTRTNKVSMRTATLMTEPGQPIIQAFGVGGSAAGTPYPGLTCNRLHIDLSQPIVLISKIGSGQFAIANHTLEFDYQPFMANLPIWFQGAWTDVNTGQLLLTNGSENFIPVQPDATLRSCVWTWTISASQGTVEDDAPANPVLRYTY